MNDEYYMRKALEQALLAFSGDTAQSHGRVIILITDGEDHEGNVMQAAERAAEQGIRIFTIGIGTPEGAPCLLYTSPSPRD